MTKNKEYLMDVYQSLSDWLDEMKEIQKPRVNELVNQANLYAKAAEGMTEEKLGQFVDNLKYDLHDFYQQNQTEIKHSIYFDLLNEKMWASLAHLTDKSQVEWAELVDDFEHDGIYNVGDVIGFGELVCQKCEEKTHIMHVCEVVACVNCGGDSFTRLPLDP